MEEAKKRKEKERNQGIVYLRGIEYMIEGGGVFRALLLQHACAIYINVYYYGVFRLILHCFTGSDPMLHCTL